MHLNRWTNSFVHKISGEGCGNLEDPFRLTGRGSKFIDVDHGLREGLRHLVKESALSPEDFAKLQKAIVALRNNLIKGTKGTAK